MPSDNHRRARILLIDDDDNILRFVDLKLRLLGYDVAKAINGREALNILKSFNPDIAVLDILMPVMDGFEMLRELRTFSTLPVIVLSAKGDNADKAMGMGASDFISKPFKPDELVAKIEANLEQIGEPQ